MFPKMFRNGHGEESGSRSQPSPPLPYRPAAAFLLGVFVAAAAPEPHPVDAEGCLSEEILGIRKRNLAVEAEGEALPCCPGIDLI